MCDLFRGLTLLHLFEVHTLNCIKHNTNTICYFFLLLLKYYGTFSYYIGKCTNMVLLPKEKVLCATKTKKTYTQKGMATNGTILLICKPRHLKFKMSLPKECYYVFRNEQGVPVYSVIPIIC